MTKTATHTLHDLRRSTQALTDQRQAERAALDALAAHGRRLVEAHGAEHEFREAVAAAAVRLHLTREATRTAARRTGHTYAVRLLADGLAIVSRDGTELARGEATAVAIAGLVLRRELGAEHQKFSTVQFARDFKAVFAGQREITSEQIRSWAAGQA